MLSTFFINILEADLVFYLISLSLSSYILYLLNF